MDTVSEVLAQVQWRAIGAATLRVAIVVVLVGVARALTRIAVMRLEKTIVERAHDSSVETRKRAATLTRLVRHAAIVAITVVGALTVLAELGLDIGPILASAGIIGVAVGFGAQNLVRDVISGFFLVVEDQVRVGDVARINGTGGLVEHMSLRTTVLRDLGGVVHVFPNGSITSLSNMTKDWSAYVLDIGVAYKEDTDHVISIMRAVAGELRADPEIGPQILEDIEIFGVDAFAESAVVIKARLKTQPIQQWLVGRAYLGRLKKAFDAAGVEIPFPHRTLFIRDQPGPLPRSARLAGPPESAVPLDKL